MGCSHTLTSRLRHFEEHGIVTRTAYAEIPPPVEYRLTPLGGGLAKSSKPWHLSVVDPGSGPDAACDM